MAERKYGQPAAELDRTLEALSILEAASLVGDERAAELRAEIETGVWART